MDHHASSDARLFLATIPDADTAARIYQLAGVLKRAHKFGGKLVEGERLHVSLFFLGGLSAHMVRMACEAVADVRARPVDVLFDRSVSFRSRARNRPLVLSRSDRLEPVRALI